VPWGRKSKGERLADLVDQSLEQTRRILEIELDPENTSPAGIKLVSIVTNAALTVLSLQLRVDEAALRGSAQNDFDYGEFYRTLAPRATTRHEDRRSGPGDAGF
jgi:hypothetical protein